jgi:hypothetical protein
LPGLAFSATLIFCFFLIKQKEEKKAESFVTEKKNNITSPPR